MIRIIDETLCMLEKNKLTKERILEWTVLAKAAGIQNILINSYIYYLLDEKLPEGFQYYMNVDIVAYMNDDYPEDENIKYYFVPKNKKRKNDIESFQINQIEEPYKLPNRINDSPICITGLDKLILNGCHAGFEALQKKVSLETLILCPEDTYCCATATAVMFLERKGYAVITSLYGIGNKAATEQVVMAMHVLDRYMVNKSFEGFIRLKQWLEALTEKKLSPMAPVLGERIFYVESGVHVDGILKNTSNYEPYDPELVGLERKIVLGKHSGKSSVIQKLEEYHLTNFSQKEIQDILLTVKELTMQKGSGITDQEFLDMIEGYKKNEKRA